MSLYAYSLNNPTKFTDPSGHRAVSGCEEGQIDGCDPAAATAQANYNEQRAYYQACENGTGSNCPDTVGIVGFVGVGLVGSAALPSVAGAVGPASDTIYGASLQLASWCGANPICGAIFFGAGAKLASQAAASGETSPVSDDQTSTVVQFSPHALDRMGQRGVPMEQVQDIMNNIEPFQYFHYGVWKTGFYDPVSKIFVGVVQDVVTTVITNVKLQYIQNLQDATP